MKIKKMSGYEREEDDEKLRVLSIKGTVQTEESNILNEGWICVYERRQG